MRLQEELVLHPLVSVQVFSVSLNSLNPVFGGLGSRYPRGMSETLLSVGQDLFSFQQVGYKVTLSKKQVKTRTFQSTLNTSVSITRCLTVQPSKDCVSHQMFSTLQSLYSEENKYFIYCRKPVSRKSYMMFK